MDYNSFLATQNPDGSYNVQVDGKSYKVKDQTELVHFLRGESYEGVQEGGTNDGERKADKTV